jgi:hypothetical protein
MSDIDDQLSMLCEVCLNVFSLNADNDTEYSHHPNLEALRQAKGGGCSLCNVIGDSIQDHYEGEIVWRRRKIFDQPPVILQFYSKNHEAEEDWRVDLGIGPLKRCSYETVPTKNCTDYVKMTIPMATSHAAESILQEQRLIRQKHGVSLIIGYTTASATIPDALCLKEIQTVVITTYLTESLTLESPVTPLYGCVVLSI